MIEHWWNLWHHEKIADALKSHEICDPKSFRTVLNFQNALQKVTVFKWNQANQPDYN